MTPRHFAWQALALGDIYLGFAWQAWPLVTSTFVLRGRCSTWRHLPWFCVAGVALGDICLRFACQACHLGHWAGSGVTHHLCHTPSFTYPLLVTHHLSHTIFDTPSFNTLKIEVSRIPTPLGFPVEGSKIITTMILELLKALILEP